MCYSPKIRQLVGSNVCNKRSPNQWILMLRSNFNENRIFAKKESFIWTCMLVYCLLCGFESRKLNIYRKKDALVLPTKRGMWNQRNSMCSNNIEKKIIIEIDAQIKILTYNICNLSQHLSINKISFCLYRCQPLGNFFTPIPYPNLRHWFFFLHQCHPMTQIKPFERSFFPHVTSFISLFT